MSSTNAENRPEKEKQGSVFNKDISFNIREDIISKEFILRTIRSFIEKHNEFKEDIIVKSPLGDSMIMTIKKGDKEIVISTKHENDIKLNIKGHPELIKNFVHEITLEAVTTVASEFAGCIIKAKKPDFSIEVFRNNLQKHLHHALHLALEESIGEKLD
jgi:hypothetical protein